MVIIVAKLLSGLTHIGPYIVGNINLVDDRLLMSRLDSVRKTRGRPPLPAGKARTRRLVTFLTEVQYAQLECIADERQLTLSALLHEIASNYLDKET